MLDLTSSELEALIMNTDPVTLEASEALQAAYEQAGTAFLPPLNHISRDKLLRIAIEVKDYTERCWRASNRLRDVQPTPSRLNIPEFGL
jgi:hypothetical protein